MAEVMVPASSPISGAVEDDGIWITHMIEQQKWKSCYVPTSEIEPKYTDWDQIRSTEGIYVIWKFCDGKFYEVAINESYVPWLLSNNFKFESYLKFDRTKPADMELQVYGELEARRRVHAKFFQNAVNAISAGREGLDLHIRLITPVQLKISLENAIINRDVQESSPQVREKYVQCLVINALNLVKDYDTPSVLKLLQKNQDEVLETFRKDWTDLLGDGREFHDVSLRRRLLVFAGGREDVRQIEIDPRYTATDNARRLASLVHITGSNCLVSPNSQALHKALSESKVFANDDCMLDITGLIRQMITSLPIGFPHGYLNIPAEVLYGFGAGQIDQIRVLIEHIYHKQPSLRKPENNLLVLLTRSSMFRGQSYQALSKWAASADGWNFFDRLIGYIRDPQPTEQLALQLAALLCYERLLPHSLKPIKVCYLADFNSLIPDQSFTKERTVLEVMVFSFLQVLNNFRGDWEETHQLLVTVLDMDTTALKSSDSMLDQYWKCRIKDGLAHKVALETLKYSEPDIWELVVIHREKDPAAPPRMPEEKQEEVVEENFDECWVIVNKE